MLKIIYLNLGGINCVLTHKITSSSHLSGAFCLVFQSRSYGYAPSSQDKNHSEICAPGVNKYWGTGSKLLNCAVKTGYNVYICPDKKFIAWA